jgi:glutamate-5-semialdehyde dehydrogenase
MSNAVFERVRRASRTLGLVKPDVINSVLLEIASEAEQQVDSILAENSKDLTRMSPDDPKYDRLQLTSERVADIAKDLRQVAMLPSPLGIVLEERHLESGLHLAKTTVPLGVVGVIYEARPNVTFDVFSLCLKSGNACVLKGGSDAIDSNRSIVNLIKDILRRNSLDDNIVELLPADRGAAQELLDAVGYVDVVIPRGSQQLIDSVRKHAKVPVIETGAGIVHTYFHKSGDTESGAAIIFNAKTRRVSVCNALDCLIIDVDRVADLPLLTKRLAEKSVTIFADDSAYDALRGSYPAHLLHQANATHYGTEFLDYKMSIKTVPSIHEALEHIYVHGSRHSEAIVAEDENAIDEFMNTVDAAVVYANASTAFTDGAQFGLGAEIGISTQKLHARGPMALRELTSYKWMIRGSGTTRNP